MGAEIATVAGLGLWLAMFAIPRVERWLAVAAALAWLTATGIAAHGGGAASGVWFVALAAGAALAAAVHDARAGAARGFAAAAALAAAWAFAQEPQATLPAGSLRLALSLTAGVAWGAGIAAALARPGHGLATAGGAALAALVCCFAWTGEGWSLPVGLASSDGATALALGLRSTGGEIDGAARALVAPAPGGTMTAWALLAAGAVALAASLWQRTAVRRVAAGGIIVSGTALVAAASVVSRRVAPDVDIDALVAATVPSGTGAMIRSTAWPGDPAHATAASSAALFAVGIFVIALGAARTSAAVDAPRTVRHAGVWWAAAAVAVASIAALTASSTLPAQGPAALASAMAAAASGFGLLESGAHGDLVRRLRYAVVGAIAVALLAWTGGPP